MHGPSPREIRLVLVEDEPLYRDMLAQTLNQLPGLQVVGSYDTAEAALAEAPALRPDVALLDLVLGAGMNGVQLGLALAERLPNLGIIVLSNTPLPALLKAVPPEALQCWSLLHKQAVSNLGALQRAIESVADGLVVLDPAVRSRMGASSARAELTPRQVEVLTLMADGLSNEGIAERLGLSPKTVANYIDAIYERLMIDPRAPEVQPRVQAVLYYLKEYGGRS